jgi:glycosyltransferase involved in cell wall biosynthesis
LLETVENNNLSNVVVMAVNNPASNDFRVVKSAEMIAKAGYDCHVVGVLKPGYVQKERVNGVTYHRVKLKLGFSAFIAGFSPNSYVFIKQCLRKARNRQEFPTLDRSGSGLEDTKPLHYLLNLLQYLFGISALAGVLLLKAIFYSIVFFALPILFLILLLIMTGLIAKVIFNEPRKFFMSVDLLMKKVKKLPSFGMKFVNKILQKGLSIPKKYLRPEFSHHGVRYLQGLYLSAFHDKLVALNGGLYHAHELWMLESCSIVAKSLGSKLVYDSHELELHRNNNWSIKSNVVRCDYEKRYIRNADVVFAVSEGCAREIAKTYSLKKVPLLRNTPLLSGLVETDENLRSDLDIATDTKLLIYTGSVTINRGVELILKALQHLPHYALVTIGPWNEAVKLELESLACDLEVQDRFHMHAKVPPAELISLASQGDVAVIPIRDVCLSYRYCMPNKLFEAAFAGLPIVASNLPDMERFIIANDLGLVFETDSVESLIEAINEIENSNFREKVLSKIDSIRNTNCFEKEVVALTNSYQMLFNAQPAYKTAKAV